MGSWVETTGGESVLKRLPNSWRRPRPQNQLCLERFWFASISP
ncbi:hypothetical protein MC885_016713, partial [Smutsia gigantea]